MDAVEKLNTYRVTYKTISPNGILGIETNTSTVEAQNNDEAINFIRSEALSNGKSGIRIVKIQRLNEPPKIEVKKRKTILGWVFAFLFVGAMLARVVSKLS